MGRQRKFNGSFCYTSVRLLTRMLVSIRQSELQCRDSKQNPWDEESFSELKFNTNRGFAIESNEDRKASQHTTE